MTQPNLTMTQPNFQQQDEFHHIFVAYHTASEGGIQKVTLRSGKSYEVKIMPNSAEGSKFRLKGCGLLGNDVILVLHNFLDATFNESTDIDKLIYRTIANTDIKPESKTRCRTAYKGIRNSHITEDLAALNLLDFIVSYCLEESPVFQRYTTASQNSRLIEIEKSIEDTLLSSTLQEVDKELIRGTYQSIRAGEYINDFEALNKLDTIIQNSSLPEELKQVYFRASVTSKAITTDLLVVNLIDTSANVANRSEIFTAYTKLRDGEKVTNQNALNLLDLLILNSSIPDECKIIYKLMCEPVSTEKGEFGGDDTTIAAVKKVADSVKKASGVVPTAGKVATTLGAKASTGAAFGTFFGGAATNATLAWLGGGSVAAGGLGMLGGLAVATGGAALIGAAALVSVASITQLDTEDKKNLGIAAGAGVATSAAAVWTTWAAVSTFGVASTGTAIGTLSGAAAYSATMAALGGVSVMTGGAALIAAGAGFAVWKFLKGKKNDPRRIMKQLEAQLYS